MQTLQQPKTCKFCGKPISGLNGLKDFCSIECKNNYRKQYKKEKERKRRRAIKTTILERGQCGIDNCIKHQNVDTTEPITTAKTDTKKSSSNNFKTSIKNSENLTVEEFAVAKQCCNYEFKEKAHYCVSLSAPYEAFEIDCRDCYYFSLLKKAYQNKKFKK